MTTAGKTASVYLAKPYARKLTPDPSGGFSASILEFPGCFAEGESADEAVTNLDKAAVAWLEATIESGRPVPEPVDAGDFSGKIALRIARHLHAMAAERAVMESVSLNQLLATAIANYLGQADGVTRSLEVVRQACSFMVRANEEFRIYEPQFNMTLQVPTPPFVQYDFAKSTAAEMMVLSHG